MKKAIHLIFGITSCLIAVFFLCPLPAYATTTITTCAGLEDIGNDLSEDYVLGNDIDCSGVSDFTQIGTYASPFTGTLDGQGYTISNLTVSTASAGLFAHIATGSTVQNLGLIDIAYDSLAYGGAITAYLDGTLSHVYVSGGLIDCTGASYCGGLVGYLNDASAIVTSSYSNVSLLGNNSIGGIVGRFATGTISHVYAVGSISGSTKYGIVGSVDGGVPNISGAYYDVDTTGASDNSYGTPTTTARMMTQSTFSGWDFTVVGDGTVGEWIMAGYPHLQMEHRSTITTLTELQLIAVDRSDDYTISNDIDASSTTGWNNSTGFEPIGDNSAQFTGSIDGNGYTISGFYSNRPAENYVTLIGYVNDSASISNLRMTDADITGDRYVTGFAGVSRGALSNLSFSGSIVGDSVIAGIAGENAGTLTQCQSTGTITGTETSYYVAGIAGNNTGTLTNCYSSMDVSGSDLVAGLVGDNYNGGTIRYSYAVGEVSGDTNVGGLVGRNYFSFEDEIFEGTVENSFYDSTTSLQSDTDKGTGKTAAEMKALATFTDTDTSGLTTAWDFVGTPYDDEGTSSIWEMDPAINSGYPVLAWEQSDTNAPSAPSGVASSVSGSTVTLSWTNPTASDFVSLTVRRSTSAYPSSVSDGTAVTSATTTTGIADLSLSDGTYYYSIFALDNTGNVSVAATLLVTIATSVAGGNGSGSGMIILPEGIGSGSRDATLSMNKTDDIGELTEGGVNLLGYIHSGAVFHLSDGHTHTLTIIDVNLSLPTQVTVTIASEPQTITLDLGHSARVDVDGDGVDDMSILFTDVWVNRVELTMHALLLGSTNTTDISPEQSPIVVEEPQAKDSIQCEPLALTRTLAQGMSGSDVLALQIYLNTHGAILATEGPGSVGNETTYFGSRTRSALVAFQRAHTLAQSGSVDTAMQAYLGCTHVTSVSPVTAQPSQFSRDLSLGMSGTDVRALQIYLNTHGFPLATTGPGAPGEETTYFGTLTGQALILFQTSHSIPAYGYFGSLTRNYL